MKLLQAFLATAVGWFFLLYNVERLHEPINIASFVYAFAAFAAVSVLLIPRLRRLPILGLALLPLPFYFGIKAWLGYGILGRSLPITVTELCAIEVTLALVHLISRQLDGLAEAISLSFVSHLRSSSAPFELGQSEIYREIHRARRHKRPLSMLSILPYAKEASPATSSTLERMRRESLERYMQAQVADLLVDEMDDSDIVTQRTDHFVTVLPETGREEASLVAKRIEAMAEERLGLSLKIGVSSFPDQEITFDKLIESAEAEMRSKARGPDRSTGPAIVDEPAHATASASTTGARAGTG